MPNRMTSFKITEQNDHDMIKVAKKDERSFTWIINKALSIYLQNNLGRNYRRRDK